MNFREPEGMLARWLSFLNNYDFEVQHRRGALHSNADGLSRIPSCRCKCDDCEECALRQSDCVCVVTRGQANKQRITLECRDSEDGVSERRSCIESADADGSSVPCRESTHGNGMVVLTPHQAAGLIGPITLALVLHLEGSQLVPGFQIATGLIDGLLMS